MGRRRLGTVLGLFGKRDRAVLMKNFGLADLSPFGLRPWQPPEPKDRGLAPEPTKRLKWLRNLTDPNETGR